MREHPVCAADRLRALQVRVRREDRRLELLGLGEHRPLQIEHERADLRNRVDRPQTRRGGDLIVAAAPRVKARCGLAGLDVQEAIDHRVNVFVGCDRLLASRDFRGDGGEAGRDASIFVRREDAGVGERRRPGGREFYIEGPEPEIDVDRAMDGVEGGVGTASETPSPEFVGVRVVRAHGESLWRQPDSPTREEVRME